MIDFSNEVFTAVAERLRSKYKGVTIIGEYVDTPTRFPCVTVDETSNVPVHLDSAQQSKYARVRYRVQVFSNLQAGKRSQARAIYSDVTAVLEELGMYAKSYTTTPTVYNSEIYCITGTFEAVFDKTGVIYRG